MLEITEQRSMDNEYANSEYADELTFCKNVDCDCFVL